MAKQKVAKDDSGSKQPNGNEKRHMGAKKRVILVVLPLLLTIAVAVGALLWALPNMPFQPQQNALSYQGVVEMWNVESFEGGVGSREGWLKRCAAKFEQANKGLFVHVTTLNISQLQQKMTDGAVFDMICFSRGAGALVQEKLIPTDIDDGAVRQNFLLSGQVNSVQYAVPVFSGAYCLFARKAMLGEKRLPDDALDLTFTRKVGKNNVTLSALTCGFTPYNSPLSALAMSGGRGKAALPEDVTQYQAYEKFLDNRTAVALLGTQRDMYRLGQRESDGRMEELVFVPLCGYTDLVQYVGIAQSDKTEACRTFLTHLLSEQSQASLTDLCMFSVTEDSFYTSERFIAVESGLAEAYVPNVFGDSAAIARQRKMAVDTLAA